MSCSLISFFILASAANFMSLWSLRSCNCKSKVNRKNALFLPVYIAIISIGYHNLTFMNLVLLSCLQNYGKYIKNPAMSSPKHSRFLMMYLCLTFIHLRIDISLFPLRRLPVHTRTYYQELLERKWIIIHSFFLQTGDIRVPLVWPNKLSPGCRVYPKG